MQQCYLLNGHDACQGVEVGVADVGEALLHGLQQVTGNLQPGVGTVVGLGGKAVCNVGWINAGGGTPENELSF